VCECHVSHRDAATAAEGGVAA